MSNHLTDAQYAAFIDRLIACRQAEDDAKEDTKLVYAELADAGEDKTAAGLIVRGLRMSAKDRAKANLRDAAVENGFDRYNRGKASHVRAREASIPEHDAETGEVKESTAASVSEPRLGMSMPGKDASWTVPQASHADNREAVTGPHRESGERNSGNTGGRQLQPALRTGVAPGAVDTITEPEAAMLPQTAGSETAVASSPSVEAAESPGNDGAGTSSAGMEGEADRQPIHEPVTDPTAVSLPAEVTEAGDRSAVPPPSAAPVVASNVTAFRTHNPATHFLNSKGMPRLHGCLNAEACAGSHRALCFGCSTQHEGPAFQGGAA